MISLLPLIKGRRFVGAEHGCGKQAPTKAWQVLINPGEGEKAAV
jgi:hypothetical protein